MYEEKEAQLDRQDSLDALEGQRDVAKARSAFYQQQARRYQSREVRAKTYNVGKLVLRLPEKKKDKLKPKWEGPFTIYEVLTRGAYRLRDASDNRLEPNPWNAARLRRFYAVTALELLAVSCIIASMHHVKFHLNMKWGCSNPSTRSNQTRSN